MAEKIMKAFRLSPEAVNKLKSLAAEHGETETQTIENLILAEGASSEFTTYEALFAKLEEHFHSWMTGLLLSSRQAERSTWILIEMLNSYILNTIDSKDEMYTPSLRINLARAKTSKNRAAEREAKSYFSKTLASSMDASSDYFAYVKQIKDNKPQQE